MCYYCYWGVPLKVSEIYRSAKRKLLNNFYDTSVLHFGPSHVVWEDYNFEKENIEYCIECCENKKSFYYDFSDFEIMICKESLIALLKLEKNEREIEPENYELEHPENYPPSLETVGLDE